MLKKLTTSILLTLALNSLLAAQTSVGIRSGMVISTVTGRAEPQATAFGGTAGFIVQHKFSERIGLNADVLFTTKGYISRSNTGGNKTKEKTRLQYIDIPVIFRTYFGKHEVNKGYFGFGPHVGIGLYEKYIRIEYLVFDKRKILMRNPFTEKFNRVEAGLNLELGYVVELKEKRALEFNFRQAVAFTKLSDVDLLGKVRNIYLSLSLAYVFGLN